MIKNIMSGIFSLVLFLCIMFLVIGALSYILSLAFLLILIVIPIAIIVINLKAHKKR